MNWHTAVVAATSGVLPSSTYADGTTDANGGLGIGATLTATANAALAIDSVSVNNGNRVLIKNQADAKQNGIYIVTDKGSASTKWILTRATDSNNSTIDEVAAGDAVYVLYGSTNTNQSFVATMTGSGTDGLVLIGTDSITWTQFSGASSFVAGSGLLRTGNTVDVVSSTLAVSADSVDLSTLSRSNTTGSETNNLISSITTDTYGRVTGVVTSPINVATSSQQGVATFNTASFTVTSGDVTIKSGGVSNNQLANSTISGVALGSNLNALTIGTGLSGTSYNGSTAITIANTGVLSINGSTGAITGIATNASPTFTGTVTFPLTTAGYVTTTSGGVISSVSSIPNSGLTNSSVTVGTTAISLGSSSTTLAGLTSVTSTGFTGALTGNADTATKLETTRAINGINFDGSAAITVKASTTNALTIGTGLSGTSFDGSGAVTIAIDSTVATLSGTQTLTGKTFDTAGTGNVFKIAGTQISANTGTGSNVLAASPTLSGTLSAAAITTTGDVTVGGNLTVNGTTTTINSTTLNTTEQVLVISNTATPTDVTANGAGITIKGATDKTVKWYSSTGSLTSSENIDLASGKTYKINGTTVLSATAVGGQTIPASAIVGLTDTQTLTNKTLTSPVIATISNTGTLTLPTSTDTLVGRATTDTLTNKTLTSPSISNAAMSGTSTYASGGKIQFSDGTQQSTAGVPSLTTIGTSISASTTIGAGLTDQMIPVAGTVNITIPTNATTAYAVGTSIDFYQASGSAAAFVAASGVTFINTPGLKMRATGSVATAMKIATDTWLIFGDLTA